MRITGRRQQIRQRQKPQAKGKRHSVEGTVANRPHGDVWRRGGMAACSYDKQPCGRFAMAQDREHENADGPWRMGRAISELGKGEKQRDNALQHPPVHPDCRASVQFRRSMTAEAIVRAEAARWISSGE
jgi:hypothetical protein